MSLPCFASLKLFAQHTFGERTLLFRKRLINYYIYTCAKLLYHTLTLHYDQYLIWPSCLNDYIICQRSSTAIGKEAGSLLDVCSLQHCSDLISYLRISITFTAIFYHHITNYESTTGRRRNIAQKNHVIPFLFVIFSLVYRISFNRKLNG